ncbi:MAG TPA: VanW family protein [Acidimicrobiia bacterium]|nr:VanW family protein [Acidimicrobiia bacterium]
MSLTSAWTRRVLWGMLLTTGFLVLAAASASKAQASGDDPADEILFYREDGLYRYYDIREDASLPSPVQAGDQYTKGWTAITAIDLDGQGQDEMFFYREDGLFRYYNIRPDGRIGSPILAGDSYTSGWTAITAVDLDGDGQDEMFFYRDDGLFRYYNIRPDGTLGQPIQSGSGYTPGWSSITAIDLDGDQADEMLFYRSDGLYRFYDPSSQGALSSPILGGSNYTTGWSSITAVNLQGDLPIERISRFTTFFDCCQNRVTNIRLIAAEINGTVVQPGETFSVDAITGPRTSAGGYLPAPYLQEGAGQCCAVGGGVSQFGTTIFNAVFWGGLDDVEHQPHSGWISRYPLGIEATLVYSSIDVKFRNDTATPITIRTSSTATSVTVELWGNQGGWQVTGFHPRGSRSPSITVVDSGGANAKRVSGQVFGSAPGLVRIVRTLRQGGSSTSETWWWNYVS